jgi:hypothetical protein
MNVYHDHSPTSNNFDIPIIFLNLIRKLNLFADHFVQLHELSLFLIIVERQDEDDNDNRSKNGDTLDPLNLIGCPRMKALIKAQRK